MNIKIDPSFERLRKTLLLQGKADRTPLFDFNINKEIKEKMLGRPLVTAKDEIDFWMNSGYDYVQMRLIPNSPFGKVSNSISTSHGNLKSMEELCSNEFEWTPFLNKTWKREDYNYNMLFDIYNNLPDGMKLIVHGADIFTRSWIIMGFEEFSYALYEDEELIAELFRQNAAAELEMLDVLVQNFSNKIGAVFYSDDLAYTEGLMVSENVYRKYLWPYLRQIIQIAKDLNVPFIYHTDGKLWRLFDDFAEMGVNGIQPLEPKSMDLKELKEKEGHRFCLMGSIDIDLLSRGTREEIDAMVAERIQTLGYNGGYTVGTSNTVPEYVNVNNYKAMIEAAFRYV